LPNGLLGKDDSHEGSDWLGRRIQAGTLDAISQLSSRYGISFVGEGEWYETFVLDAPFFNRGIVEVEKVWKDSGSHFNTVKDELEDK
jgi:diphthamide synthase (EF-2-diphthine--ammonia ligase)